MEVERQKLEGKMCKEGYKLLEPRCIKIRQPVKSNNKKPSKRNRVLAAEKVKIEKVINRLREQVKQSLHRHSESHGDQGDSTPKHPVMLNKIYFMMLKFMPIFILHATTVMLDSNMIEKYPDVRDRYRYISNKFVIAGQREGGVFTKKTIVEYTVMKLTLKRLDDARID